MSSEEIRRVIDDPSGLEDLYRKDPDEFSSAFFEVFTANPESPLLQAWNERLRHAGSGVEAPVTTNSREKQRAIFLVVVLGLIAGALNQIPITLDEMEIIHWTPRFIPFILFMSLSAYFLIMRRRTTKEILAVVIPAGAAMLFLATRPNDFDSATLVLTYLFIPVLWWSLLGLSFMGGFWGDAKSRIEFLRYNGELIIYTAVILLGGMVLTGVTMALFGIAGLDIGEWYMRYVVTTGVAAAPLVGTLLVDQVVGDRFKLAPILAKVFTPLFLITVVVFIGGTLTPSLSPSSDREFLLILNVLLLVVLTLTILVIAERGKKSRLGASDIMTTGLILVTLVINMMALTAVMSRISTFGFSPNKLALLGTNLIVFWHLLGFAFFYLRAWLKRTDAETIKSWIVNHHIPVYTGWAVIVAIGFPFVF